MLFKKIDIDFVLVCISFKQINQQLKKDKWETKIYYPNKIVVQENIIHNIQNMHQHVRGQELQGCLENEERYSNLLAFFDQDHQIELRFFLHLFLHFCSIFVMTKKYLSS